MLGILGPLLGHFWGCQGLSWAMWKLLLATFGAINQLQPKIFRLELDFGPCWGLCWAILGLSGPILGHLEGHRAIIPRLPANVSVGFCFFPGVDALQARHVEALSGNIQEKRRRHDDILLDKIKKGVLKGHLKPSVQKKARAF